MPARNIVTAGRCQLFPQSPSWKRFGEGGDERVGIGEKKQDRVEEGGGVSKARMEGQWWLEERAWGRGFAEVAAGGAPVCSVLCLGGPFWAIAISKI